MTTGNGNATLERLHGHRGGPGFRNGSWRPVRFRVYTFSSSRDRVNWPTSRTAPREALVVIAA